MASLLALSILCGCDRGDDPRVVLRIVTPATDPFAEATSLRVTFESDPPLVVGPLAIEDGRVGVSIDLPADSPAARFVVEALAADESVLGHGATPPVEPQAAAGLEIRVLVSPILVAERGPTPPPEDLGAPTATMLDDEWFGTSTAGGFLLVYDLLVHDWARGVVEPPSSIADATAVSLPDRRLAFAGGAGRGLQIYEGFDNSWLVVEVPGAPSPWPRPASVACPDGSVLLVGGGTDAVVRLAIDGTVTSEAPLATRRTGHTASADEDGIALVVGGAVDASVEIVGCDGTREVVDDVARSDRSGHAAVRLADGSVLVAGGDAGDADALLLPADCAPAACEPLQSGPLLPDARGGVALAALPEGGVVLVGDGEALGIDVDSWIATPLGGDVVGEAPAAFAATTGHLIAIHGDNVFFLAPRVLY